ncbi:MAG: amidohydrolase [Anaerovoracaceae bacterium]|jgi:5-methylthioadenosine/S-adenosylhomocysteine deaminase
MLFEQITLIDEDIQVREKMYVGTKGGYIQYVGKERPDEDFGEVYNGKGKLLMTGFFNAHAHSPMTLMRGYGENMNLQDWLTKKIFPFEAKLGEESVYYGTMLAMAESVAAGIVSTSDMYYFSEAMAAAILESGTKNNLSRSIVNFTGEDLWDMDGAREMKALYQEYHGAGEGRLLVDMSLHAEYTSDPKTVAELAAYTKEIGGNMQVHVSETASEHEECKRKYGMTPVAYLDSHGLLGTRTTAAHCVHIEGEDYGILRDRGVVVAVNPVSNMKLASGVCNVPALLQNGVKIALGTDSVASNNSLNFVEEMKVMAIGTAMMYPDLPRVTPEDAIRAATAGGAYAQGRDDCGKLAEGYKADLIVMDISGPSMHPIHSTVNNLVYSSGGSGVCMTMVDGKVLYKDGEYLTLDAERIIFEVEKATGDILRRLDKEQKEKEEKA